uniref:Putative secreted protein n=1 Tax=Panstrongylus lignarius TaxID=156445 RepID=A0A224Y338_9HEMI
MAFQILEIWFLPWSRPARLSSAHFLTTLWAFIFARCTHCTICTVVRLLLNTACRRGTEDVTNMRDRAFSHRLFRFTFSSYNFQSSNLVISSML